jgi:hypothetical protein
MPGSDTVQAESWLHQSPHVGNIACNLQASETVEGLAVALEPSEKEEL